PQHARTHTLFLLARGARPKKPCLLLTFSLSVPIEALSIYTVAVLPSSCRRPAPFKKILLSPVAESCCHERFCLLERHRPEAFGMATANLAPDRPDVRATGQIKKGEKT